MTPETTLPQLKPFLNDGGTIITVGSATSLGYALDLPIENHLLVRAPGQPDRALAGRGVLCAGFDPPCRGRQHRAGGGGYAGAARRVLRQQPGVPSGSGREREGRRRRSRGSIRRSRCAAVGRGDRTISRAARPFVEANYGKGKVYMFGPEITFRGQPHGTFKFLFNGIYAPTNVASPIVP